MSYFTCHLAAVSEADFIQCTLQKTAYIVTDAHPSDKMHVITADQYASDKWKHHTVLEVFHKRPAQTRSMKWILMNTIKN